MGKVIERACPICNSYDYKIIRYDLVEDELGIKYTCKCGNSWRNWYSLSYNGYSIKDKNYTADDQEE